MDNIQALQIIKNLERQNVLFTRLVTASERTNELLFALLSPEQKQTVQKADAQRAAKKINKARQP